jgi:hypothetical protein
MPDNITGGCVCGAVRYHVTRSPLIVHGCHCRWCQRETGGAFAINALVERAALELLTGSPEEILTPSESGKGQRICRCPTCKVAVWSHYAGAGPGIAFLRVGTLDDPDQYPPDVHIYTASKQPWLSLPTDARMFPEFYDAREVWSEDVIARFKAARTSAAAPQ